ncbi:hypothetical protein AB0368_24430 [Actinoplanes sp. NPDC051475]|uniref:hypothetical protein n=1 Tax=Actinoplanes sp. NPDC051475 TaxID=3157225 RepID=UPI00344CC6FE
MPDGIQIDTEQVGEFAQGMRAEADKGFASAADRGADLHQHGVVFGARIPGDTVLDAKRRYAEALANTDANLRAYKQMAMIFADVAEKIAKEFATADISSEAAQRRIDALLQGAVVEAGEVKDGRAI